ncbi:hypothetical protein [Levilactobacillus brevis]|uniref:hypothetical protein n=1 Tax=Levilactobacillus brevis TaxID=1580 RepID=UPI0022E2243E|nr:hypothetical protein [Levilactobacillus brevis]
MNEQEIIEWILRGTDSKTFNTFVTEFKGKVGGVPHKANSRMKRAIIDRMLLPVNYQKTKIILKKIASTVPKEDISKELSKYSNDKVFSQIIRLVSEHDLEKATSYVKEINSRKENLPKKATTSQGKSVNVNKRKREKSINIESGSKLVDMDTSLLVENKKLEKKINFFRTKIKELNSKIDRYASIVEKLEEDSGKKKVEIKHLKMKEDGNSKYIEKKKNEIELITQKNNELKDRIDGLLADQTEKKREIEDRDLQIENLNMQLRDKVTLIGNLGMSHKQAKSGRIESHVEHNLQIGIPEDLDVEKFRRDHSDTDIIVPQPFFSGSEGMKYYTNVRDISESLGKKVEDYDNVFLYGETVPYGDKYFLKTRVKDLKTVSRSELVKGEIK